MKKAFTSLAIVAALAFAAVAYASGPPDTASGCMHATVDQMPAADLAVEQADFLVQVEYALAQVELASPGDRRMVDSGLPSTTQYVVATPVHVASPPTPPLRI